jgi:glucosylceramidase
MEKTFIRNANRNFTVNYVLSKSIGKLLETLKSASIPLLLLTFFSLKINAQTVNAWMTSGDKSSLLEQQASVNFTSSGIPNSSMITVDPATTYQTMDGFGFCMTEGSAEVISSLATTQQESLLTELFSRTAGIGISVIRISIGASDLSSSDYSYDDLTSGTDVTMSKFSLKGPDSVYLIPVLQKALAINPDIKILATPWSAPKWMKSNNSWVGGSLQTQYYAAYASYFVKYIKAMKTKGITIWGITPQNEPENPNNEPSLVMNATEETNFINNNLGPAFQSALIPTKIIAFDHNCDHPNYPIYVCNHSTYVDGSAFHLYAGSISALTTVHDSTSKNIYFTEQWTSSDGDFSGDFSWHLQNVMLGAPNNWAKAAIEWNLATNASYGPHTPGGCSKCLGAITVTNSTNYTRNVSFYIVGQLSQFVQGGAVRISSVSTDDNLKCTAYKNPDGSVALVVMNTGSNAINFKVNYGSVTFTYLIPMASAITFVWADPSGISVINSHTNTLFPNPVEDILNIDLTSDGFSSLVITDLSGNEIQKQAINTSEKKVKIDMNKFSSGFYLIQLSGRGGKSTYKVFKK